VESRRARDFPAERFVRLAALKILPFHLPDATSQRSSRTQGGALGTLERSATGSSRCDDDAEWSL